MFDVVVPLINFEKNRVFILDKDAQPFFAPLSPRGKLKVLPNLKEIIDPARALFEIAISKALSPAPHDLAFQIPGQLWPNYCKVFLRSTPMGGGWDGSGVLLEMQNSLKPRVFTFALCAHERTEEGHSPNQGRGWHPAHCKHCGMNMTVDSGD